ncbi:MAG: phosphate ABC transporter permease PstA, partial [Shewanella sp.]
LNSDYLVLEQTLFDYRKQAQRDSVVVKDMRGQDVRLNLSQVLAISYPNDLHFGQKITHWLSAMAGFVVDDPREANTEGGVFPAIFGTVFMVMLMAVIVTPFGVIAAVYLHEYAKKGPITKMIRIAVINLAGVPSIVYGVFGLGFFVYMMGGSIDQLFYPEALPAPTFGSPGVLWSALTLAILTLPVVIVSTEEGLSRIPSAVRQGSLALGATKAETLWRIVIPMASPAIMTGLILAVARAAGEVAPLMLVGVVKLAPTLPLDWNFPFVHLDRKFMHLGFHIYDVGFQSPNVEAARPLVYATSFLLVGVIMALNITAIGIRNHLREKYRSLEH